MKQTKDKKQTKNFFRATHYRISQIDSSRLFYMSIGLLLLSLGTLASAIILQQNSPKLSTAPTPFSGYSVGTPVSMGLVSMEVESVVFSDGQPGFKAPANMHYAIVDFTVKNNADKPIDVLPSSDTYAKDQEGRVSYLTPFGLKQPFHAGAVLPGEQVKGQLSYLVKKEGVVKMFIDSIWSGGVVPFKVQ